jgi:hypothetical protein
MTHRQFRAWHCWMDRQLNQPSRTDHYLMQVAAEICRSRVKDPSRVADSDFKIRFTDKRSKDRDGWNTEGQTAEEVSRRSKAAWFGWMASCGVKVTTKIMKPSSKEKRHDGSGSQDETGKPG